MRRDLQQPALLLVGQDRLDYMLTFGQRSDLGKIRIRRLSHEILPQIIRSHCRVYVAILQLHRHIILVVHDQRMKHPLPFAHFQRQGVFSANPLLA
ncbi:hypothetical protein D3C73_1531100 [compost metagenome]